MDALGLTNMDTLVIIGALLVNLLTIIGYSNKHERRLTRIETFVEILTQRAGLHTRRGERDGPGGSQHGPG